MSTSLLPVACPSFSTLAAMPLFDGAEFRAMIEKSTYVIVNDYESQLLQTRTGWSAADIASRVDAYIVTQGPRGSSIHAGGQLYEIPPARERQVIDPTGCGDAYRAGLIYGIMQGRDWPTTGRMASLMGALKSRPRHPESAFHARRVRGAVRRSVWLQARLSLATTRRNKKG